MSRTQLGLALFAVVPAVALSAPPPGQGPTPFVLWTAQAKPLRFDAPSQNQLSDPLVVGKLVVVGDREGRVAAYRCKDGTRAWDYEIGGTNRDGAFHLASDGERIFVTIGYRLIALTAETGRVVWVREFGKVVWPTAVVPGRGLVIAGGTDGKLYAVAAATGKPVWESEFLSDAKPRRRLTECFEEPPARPAAVTATRDAVYLSVLDQHRLIAFAADTGKRLWAFETGGWVTGRATPADDNVFVGGWDKHLYCLDKKTGAKVWTYATQDGITEGSAADEDAVYFGSWDGHLYAVNRADGKLRWRFETDREADSKPTTPSRPVLRDGYLTFVAGEGRVYAVDKKTGRLRWKFRPDGPALVSSPATDGSSYFVTTRPPDGNRGEGALIAIGLK